MLEDVSVKIGDPVIYYDDEKEPHAAIVARVYSEELVAASRPRVCLTWLGYDGMWRKSMHVEAAYHNGEQWVLLQKWAFPDEVPH